MPTDRPRFRYHPAAFEHGVFVTTEEACEVCGRARGYRYDLGVYGECDVDVVCPWCIADGSLAARFDASLVDVYGLAGKGVPAAVIAEVETRTPGYSSWQSEDWLACCNDACEFHGDVPVDELRALDAAGLERLSATSGFAVDDLREMIPHYRPRGSPAFYKFVCRHCGTVHMNGDCD